MGNRGHSQMNLETEICWTSLKAVLRRDADVATEDYDRIVKTVEAFLLPSVMMGSLSKSLSGLN